VLADTGGRYPGPRLLIRQTHYAVDIWSVTVGAGGAAGDIAPGQGMVSVARLSMKAARGGRTPSCRPVMWFLSGARASLVERGSRHAAAEPWIENDMYPLPARGPSPE
jgi:hypothetical protein